MGYFGAPQALLSISYSDIFVTTMGLWAIAMIAFPLIFTFQQPAEFIKDSVYKKYFSPLMPYYLGSFLYSICFPQQWKGWTFALGMPVLMTFYYLLWPMMIVREKTSYRDKMINSLDPDYSPKTYLAYAAKKIGKTGLTLVAFALLGILFSSALGREGAMRQKNFYVLSSSDCAALSQYNDLLICAKFDRSSKHISKDFQVINVQNSVPLGLKLEKVGPLIPDDL